MTAAITSCWTRLTASPTWFPAAICWLGAGPRSARQRGRRRRPARYLDQGDQGGGAFVRLLVAEQHLADGSPCPLGGGRVGHPVGGHRDQPEHSPLAACQQPPFGELVDEPVADRLAPAVARRQALHPPLERARSLLTTDLGDDLVQEGLAGRARRGRDHPVVVPQLPGEQQFRQRGASKGMAERRLGSCGLPWSSIEISSSRSGNVSIRSLRGRAASNGSR